jgi:glycine/D-amino acid oxidase-like deaminating enzyme
MTASADVVVVGAGIAGVSTAHELAVRRGFEKVVIVDPRPPLSLTSDKSTECYRNYWPNLPMVALMNRSIDLLDEMSLASENAFGLNRRGYLFVTAKQERLMELVESSHVSSNLGSGPVRIHHDPDSYRAADDGFDVLANSETLRQHFPYITGEAVGALHVRRAGWFSAQQLGSWMLEQAKDRDAEVVVDEVIDIDIAGGQVRSVKLASGRVITTSVVVDAAGPLSPNVARLAGVDLPVFSELHLKVAFRDHLGVIPRNAPMIIWSDPQTIAWSDEEKTELLNQDRHDLVAEMPIFCHGRPEGGAESPYLLALWEYHKAVTEPLWPLPTDPLYPEVVMRGMATMVPKLGQYLDRLPHSVVDGGYYSKTRENRPLIGPAGPEGFHLMSAMSGFGVMVAAGAADLVASHITGGPVAEYAKSFLLSRYDDPDYVAQIAGLEDAGLEDAGLKDAGLKDAGQL